MKKSVYSLLLVFMLGFGAGMVPNAYAEEAAALVSVENGDAEAFDFKRVTAALEKTEALVKNGDFTRQSLDEALTFLSETDVALDAAIKNIEKESKYAQDALSAIGEAPQEGENEDPSIAEMREKYTASVSAYKNKIIEANLLKTEISRLNAIISEARSRVLIGNLVAEQNALISPKTFWQAFADAAVFFWEVVKSPAVWYGELSDEGRKALYSKGWYVLLILGFALSFGMFVRGFIIRKWGYRHTDEMPRYGQKVLVAGITALAYGVIPSLLIGGCLLWQITNESLTHSKFGVVLANVLYYSLYITLTRAAVRVVLAPWNGKWRLFNISDERAERVFGAATFSIILWGVVACLQSIAAYFEVSKELSLLLEVTMDAVKAFVIIFLTASVFGEIKPKALENAAKTDDTTPEKTVGTAEDEEESVGFPVKILIFASLFSLVTFGVSLFGYPDLASFIFNRFFISILMFGVFVVARKVISDLLRRSIVFWITTFRMRKKLLSKADFLMSLLITPVLVMFLIYSLLRLWGVPASFMLYGIKKLVFGFKVGGIQISLVAIVAGLLVFLISLTLTKVFRNRLSNNLLSRINMDEGIKHSLVSGVTFTGFIISVILAVAAMGVDLSNLAFIAGALSVGIGFGLQDVIKNLVSGIIILFERPFKVGDWVILGGEEGKIKQINIRSTELETFTRRSVIIPNATLISSSLVNLTHGNNWQRQSILVGVSYDSDADLVTKLLLECVKSSKKVAKVPQPYVVFKDFASSSLDFEVRFYVSDIWSGWSASSDIRYEILRRFREEGINIAYPQVVVHQGSEDTSVKGWQTNV
ncbi:MAG: mechanosensitive ion channel family protein [Alphaproteobacteria bacterium]|nr:mechanosensitive ion channel family protein [Alphaproteobacteria bacterium]